MTEISTATRPRRVGRAKARRDMVAGLIFVLPMLVLFIIFRFVPTLGAVGMSFTSYKLSGEFEFIGAENYLTFFTSPVARHALVTTLMYAAIYVPMVIIVAMSAALLLNKITWGSSLFRGSMFLPYVTSFVLAGLLWMWILALDGPINALIGALGIDPIHFLGGKRPLVLFSIAVVSTWRGFGYSMLILLAGLKSINRDLYESARIDGASSWQQFWGITVPLLKPSIFFVLVIETIAAFQVFDSAYVMTGGGPARASYSLVYYLYEQGFRFFDFGYAATIGIMIFFIVFAISMVQRFILDRKES